MKIKSEMVEVKEGQETMLVPLVSVKYKVSFRDLGTEIRKVGDTGTFLVEADKDTLAEIKNDPDFEVIG